MGDRSSYVAPTGDSITGGRTLICGPRNRSTHSYMQSIPFSHHSPSSNETYLSAQICACALAILSTSVSVRAMSIRRAVDDTTATWRPGHMTGGRSITDRRRLPVAHAQSSVKLIGRPMNAGSGCPGNDDVSVRKHVPASSSKWMNFITRLTLYRYIN